MIQELILGKSQQDQPIKAVAFGAALPTVLLIAGVHADEVEGVWVVEQWVALARKKFEFKRIRVVACAVFNPDGFAAGTRLNSRGVDLNRNLPTHDWTAEVLNPRYPPGTAAASESETRALVATLERFKPLAILSVHSFSQVQVNSNGPARDWAQVLSRVCGYPVTESIGYPTPGSLGTYAGAERQIPTITLEIERGLAREPVLELHLRTVQAALEYWDNRNG